MLPAYRRILLLTEGQLGPFSSKTAASLLRYRSMDIAGILDSAAAGRDVREFVPWSPAVPIFPEISAAATLRPDALFIGIAPVGGELPVTMRRHVAEALSAGIHVVSGLHVRLGRDREFANIASRSGARIIDVREPPAGQPIACGRARGTRCRRVLTVGTDCNVGKMVTAIELTQAARNRGLRAEFLATGQTGIMISGRGVPVDAVVSDFAAGAVESLVLEAGDCDICFIEGQGSIAHPGYSGVTLSLLHGCCPDAMVLVHHAGRIQHNAGGCGPVPRLDHLRDLYELAASMLHPSRILCAALNALGAPGEVVHSERTRIETLLNVPVDDPVKDGCDRLLDAILGASSTAV